MRLPLIALLLGLGLVGCQPREPQTPPGCDQPLCTPHGYQRAAH